MKFICLLKKELKELLTPGTILVLLVSVAALIGLGSLMSTVMDEELESTDEIIICNKDTGDFSAAVITALNQTGYKVTEVDVGSDDYVKELDELEIDSVVIIPETFSAQIKDVLDKKLGDDGLIPKVDVQYVSRMNSLSLAGNVSVGSEVALSAIESAVKSVVYANKSISVEEIALIEEPINLVETTVVGDKQAEASSAMLSAYVMMSGVFVPIVVYILIMYASQMIMNAVSTEKIDKTLETLLSAPISRISVLSSKMVAAAIVSSIYAVGFLLGFSEMVGGMTGAVSDAVDSNTLELLGLKMTTGGYLLLGVQMLLSLLITLAISLILGALAKDAKSSQSLMLPIMAMAIIPYMLSMFIDFESLGALKWVLYAIPYTHTFMAQSNIILHNTAMYTGGLIYQIVLLIICMTAAVKLFMSDKIFTISLDFSSGANRVRKRKKKALKA